MGLGNRGDSMIFRHEKKQGYRKGQMTLEYALLFVAVVAVLLYASRYLTGPSINRVYCGTANLMDDAVAKMVDKVKVLGPDDVAPEIVTDPDVANSTP